MTTLNECLVVQMVTGYEMNLEFTVYRYPAECYDSDTIHQESDNSVEIDLY